MKRKYKLILVAGARPNFMKIAPIVRALKAKSNPQITQITQITPVRFSEPTGQAQISWIEYKIVHTGQHYDYEMSQAFFDDLEIPKPDYFLEAGSGSHAIQTAKIMTAFEKVCEREGPDVVIVVGDVNSTLACSIVAKKLLIKVVHVEAGLRSFDLTMPEEINRMVTDAITDYFFVTEQSALDLKHVFKEDPTLIFHLAAFFANQNSVDYPEISAEVDILRQIRLLEYSRLSRVEKFVYASSGCAIYGSYPKMPLKEDFISMHLTTPYQINKMTGEMYCNFYRHHYGMKTVNCRFFNSYGPGEAPGQYRNVIPNFIFWAMKGLSLPITGTGEETRDFTYVLDLAQGLIKAGYYEKAVGENFNLAPGTEVCIRDLANMVNEATENQAEIIFSQRRKWDTKPRLLASIEKAENLVEYKPVVNFEEGFQANIEWFKDNWKKPEVRCQRSEGHGAWRKERRAPR